MNESAALVVFFPIFLLMILGEKLWGDRILKKSLYRWNDTLADLNNGIGQQIFSVGSTLLFLLCYVKLLPFAFFRFHSAAANWITTFLLVDLFYYWFHRASHRVNFLWAAHVVHHQSEEYNLAVALRQSWVQSYFGFFWYLPLAFLGIPTEIVAANLGLNLVLQFWFHTRAINRMGFLETFLNTPSHHRVHHGRNLKYLDKNYAGVLIIWDRIFGSFESEVEEPTYGIVKPLKSWGVIRSNFHYWQELAALISKQEGLLNKLRILFLSPEATGGPLPVEDPSLTPKYDAKPVGRLAWVYVVFLFLLTLAMLVVYLLRPDFLNNPTAFVFWGAAILWGLINSGGFLERRKWVLPSEIMRLVLVIAFYSLKLFH